MPLFGRRLQRVKRTSSAGVKGYDGVFEVTAAHNAQSVNHPAAFTCACVCVCVCVCGGEKVSDREVNRGERLCWENPKVSLLQHLP